MKYSIDSSSLITAWNYIYPPDVFPGIWSRLSQAVNEENAIKMSEAVYLELEKQRDELFNWIDDHSSNLVIPFDLDIQEKVIKIEASFPSLVDIDNERDFADPFVIALAQINNCKVITEETLNPSNAKRVKIPNVCENMSIHYSNFLGMVRTESWQF